MGDIPQGINRAVLVVAPHTSNWDGYYGLLFCFVKRIPIKFVIKKEVLFFPLNLILHQMGAIPVDRKIKNEATRRGNIVQTMANMLREQASLFLIIAPEGTRRRVKRWKKGFYYIAMQANVPLIMSYIDYQKKHIGIGFVLYPTGNFDQDLQRIQDFYKDKVGKYPDEGT